MNVAATVPAAAVRLSARIAALLRTRGIEPGDRVAVMVPNVPEFAIVCYGVLRTGAVVVVLDPSLAEDDIVLALAGARLLFAWHAVAETADAAARRAATPCLFVTPGELGRLSRGLPAMREVCDRDDADVAVILGGGDQLTHGELAAAVREHGLIAGIIYGPRLKSCHVPAGRRSSTPGLV